MLNEAALPKFLRWEIAANVVFLLNRPPSKTIDGDTSYNRMSGKHADIFFLWPIGTRPHGVRQAHLALNSRHIRSRHDLHNRNSNFEPVSFSDASCSTGNSEKATSKSGSMHFLSGVIHSSARIFCDSKRPLLLAGQGSYSSRSKHLAIRFMGLRN